MIIAVNTRLRKDEQPEGYEDFLSGILDRLVKKYPQHQFIYISDRPLNDRPALSENVLTVITGPETRTRLRLQYWYNYKIPALLRKHKADVFVSMEGICSIRTNKPQCLLISDLRYLSHSLKKKHAGFYKKFTPLFIAKAKSIATVSEFSKSIIARDYKLHAGDIDVINPGVDPLFKPVDWEEKEAIKETYTDGKAYFLFSGTITPGSNLINLLKAFSIFKKRQKSNMLLVIAANADESFKKELKNYKFRSEVLLLEGLAKEDRARITAAAYAMVYPVLYCDWVLPVLEAIQCGIPVVVSNTGALPSICSEAALYSNPEDFKDIAEKMMLVFKDEDRVKTMLKAGEKLLGEFQWDKSADLFMQCIVKAFNN